MEQQIGRGTFGTVTSGPGLTVAIKRVPLAWARAAVREAAFLVACQRAADSEGIPNPIVAIERLSWVRDEVHLQLRRYDTDLRQFIAMCPYGLPLSTMKSLAYDVLKGVAFLHALGVIHRDLKPSNVLVDYYTTLSRPHAVICDLGQSAPVDEPWHAPRVQTRIYRAPEVDMISGAYGPAIDMWSVGCILYELATQERLIAPMDDASIAIGRLVGLDRRYMGSLHSRTAALLSLGPAAMRPIIMERLRTSTDTELFEELFGCGYADVMVRCLTPNPQLRITAMMAVQRISMIAGRPLSALPLPCMMSYKDAAASIYQRYVTACMSLDDEESIQDACEFIAGAIYSGVGGESRMASADGVASRIASVRVTEVVQARIVDIFDVLGDSGVWL